MRGSNNLRGRKEITPLLFSCSYNLPSVPKWVAVFRGNQPLTRGVYLSLCGSLFFSCRNGQNLGFHAEIFIRLRILTVFFFSCRNLKRMGWNNAAFFEIVHRNAFFTCPTALWGQDSYAVPLLMVMQKSSLCLSTIL